ncbi:MAG: S8 family peptidase [Chitinispirillaceae bacterium]
MNRLTVDGQSNVSVCILDTGVNNGHPLIRPVLSDADCQSVEKEWGNHDHNSHGTLMAGVAGLGDLLLHLETSGTVYLRHLLESVKILPPRGKNDIRLWGDYTSQAISLAEIGAPERKRIVCMAITSDDTRDRGRPSSWSGAIDKVTSGAEDNIKRLFIISAGNITDFNQISNYPHIQITDSIHDPGQSWNAMTVGAHTQLTQITDSSMAGYVPLAQVNQLSPFTTTSLTWDDVWPIKPEVVFEGGNMAVGPDGFATECDDMRLISTYYKPQEKLLESFNMTSAATAQAANFAAKIQAEYPDYWPESIRGLIVHSAEWPAELKAQFAASDKKTDVKKVLRACGYGIPNLERAIYCAQNSLTLLSEAEIQPFIKEDGKYRTNEMHLYELPWPRSALLDLGESPVEMRITLSYFIEPGPGEIGWQDRYRYPSHALRFDINSPTETKEELLRRINKAERDEENGKPDTSSASKYWVIGQTRNKGSIHSDIWHGTATELAASNLIAVYPGIGWWRQRSHLKMYNKKSRYSLIVTIRTPQQNVDIYTPVALKVGVPVSMLT